MVNRMNLNQWKLIAVLATILLVSCSTTEEAPSFREWYSKNKGAKAGEYDSSKLRTKVVTSENYRIDKIYRSMMGPTSEEEFQLADSGDLVWLVGYDVRVLDSAGTELSPEFMCHNNLNLSVERNFPWEPGVFAYTNRIFTLTQGYTQLQLPQGFGIPFPANQKFKAIFQALNHNNPTLDTSLYHEVTLKYYLDSEIEFPMQALSQNTVWLVKQYDGPYGVYGEKPEKELKEEEGQKFNYHEAQQPSCGVDMLANNPLADLDLYYDQYGRKFTGHWKISPGTEMLRFEATKMLNLSEDKMLYYATAHVHPYCEYLELYDITDSRTVFRTEMKSIPDKIGLEYITDFTSEEGLLLSKDHRYELVSSYNNVGDDTLSAMSVLYLYLNQ
ncbi:MAG: hypothetical protein CL840_20215 [Crocinitomicaceae bacterium]|mgnify:CR=1 FL=1|nr:hypothetical protein [Crocinitomicaceae bacterium]|tara:strand:- start:2859 stop:4016 length:1158 start_codon:yes stop_codon:yes gene_type:complete